MPRHKRNTIAPLPPPFRGFVAYLSVGATLISPPLRAYRGCQPRK